MKYTLKVCLDDNCNPVFEKYINVNSGEEYFFARSHDGFLKQIDKDWILKNQSDIRNLIVSDKGEFIPKILENKVEKVQSLISSYEVDDAGVYIIAVACPSDSSDKVFVQFHVSNDVCPEVLLYGVEANIALTQESLDKFVYLHISEHKWDMLRRYSAYI